MQVHLRLDAVDQKFRNATQSPRHGIFDIDDRICHHVDESWQCLYNHAVSKAITTGNDRYVFTWSTRGVRYVSSGPSRIEPKAMTAASRYLQSLFWMLPSTKGTTSGTIKLRTHWAKRDKQVAAAIDTVHSSSSWSSSCFVRSQRSTGRISLKANSAKLYNTRSGFSPASAAYIDVQQTMSFQHPDIGHESIYLESFFL